MVDLTSTGDTTVLFDIFFIFYFFFNLGGWGVNWREFPSAGMGSGDRKAALSEQSFGAGSVD